MKYTGSCHCQKVKFEAQGEIQGGLACNCSICSRKGSLLWFIPRGDFRLLAGEGDLKAYDFNKHVIHHMFCTTCGMHPFAYGTDPKGNEMAAINLRCVENIELEKIPVTHYDGRSV
jgi:hypothetical protein